MAEGAGLTGGISGANKGGSIGKIAGTALGSVIPGAGNAIGAMAGQAIGSAVGAGLSSLGSRKKQKQARRDIESVAQVDPEMQRRQQMLDAISRNISTGSDALTQNRIDEINRAGAQTQTAIARASGGDVGSTVQGLLKAQRNTQGATNAALADRTNLPYFQNLSQQIASRTAQRRLELDLLKRAQSSAEFAQSQKEKNLNANAALPLADGSNLSSVLSMLPKRANTVTPDLASEGVDTVAPTTDFQQMA